MALTSSSLLSPAKAASEHRARRGHQAKGNKSKRGEGEKLALFPGGVQGVDGRAAHSDERHAVTSIVTRIIVPGSPPPWPGRPDSWLFLFAGSRYTLLVQH